MYRYRLALANAQTLTKFSLNVLVASPSGAPRVALPGDAALTLAPSGTWYRGEIHRDDFKARGWVEIAIPDGSAKSAAIAASVQPWQGESYVQIDAPISVRHSARRIPAQIAIVWDSSMSGRLRDHAAEFALLDAYFHAMGKGKVSLIRVRDVAEAAQSFAIADGNWSALKRALQETVYDGATDLAAWKVDAGIAEVLLFSDGLANYGTNLVSASAPRFDLRIYPVVAAASANRGLMRQFARDGVGLGSGALIDLAGDRTQAMDALLQAGTTVSSMNSAGDGDLIVDEQALTKGHLRIAGKFRGELPAKIDVRLLEPDGSQHILSVPVGKATDVVANRGEIPLVARQWARMKIERLAGDRARNRTEIRRLGLTFSLLSAETSLIVLDDVADYVKHDIQPPASLRARFDELKAADLGRERAQLSAHIEQIAAQYQDKIEWWKRDFPKTPEVHVLAKQQIANEQESRMARQARPAPMPATATPPPPPPSPPADIAPMETVASAPQREASAIGGANKDKRSDDAASESEPEIRIGLKKWTADAPYLARLHDAADADLYAIYLDQRVDWINSSAYYLDAADILFERKQATLGLRVLSNLAEMDLENRAILRILGYRLLQAGKPALAVPLFEQVRDLAPFEPQSFRDLGLAYADIGEYQKAADALYEVAKRDWDGRFAEVGLIALTEMNALIATHPGKVDTSRFDERLLRNLPVDLRVVLNWDADNSDMDLWVTDPNGERAFYGNRLTRQGGRMSADLTSGYGPEEFMLKQAIPGKYKVEANYYGNRQQLVSGSVTLRLALITGFGKPKASEQSVILRLQDRQETVLVGEFEVAESN